MTDMQDLGTLDASMKFHDCEGQHVATFRQLREEAGYTIFKLASDANVSISTINRLDGTGKGTVTTRMANQVLSVVSEKLGRRIAINDVEGLKDRVK